VRRGWRRSTLGWARSIPLAAVFLAFTGSAQAGTAMFEASFILHAFGNDITSGASSPVNSSLFSALPLGRDCRTRSAYTLNGAPAPYHCSRAVLQQGVPATGSGTLVLGSGGLDSVVLGQSAFRATATGFLPTEIPIKSETYATFANDVGTFFVGGGPAAGLGQKIVMGTGETPGSWILNEGARGFGGVMGLLGRFGARVSYFVDGRSGTYVGTNSWNMIRALGRVPYATPVGYSAMGKSPKATNWLNPYRTTNYYTNNVNGNMSTVPVRGSGTPWTTGSVTLYALAGWFPTILHRAGTDATTPSGARSIQLVTPALTHWLGPGWNTHTGHIGILTLQIVPEPNAVLLLAAGAGVLALLRRMNRRC